MPERRRRTLRGQRVGTGGVLAGVALLVLVFGSAQAFVGATSIGITTDEPVHLSRTQSWLSDGWYVPGFYLIDGEPASIPVATPYVYGPAFESTAHAANMALGNESGGSVSESKAAWTVRHLLAALIGVATSIAVGLGAWALTGSRRFGLWTGAALLAIPIWLGMSFFNPKDVPAAAGYTFFTVGLMLAIGRDPGSPTSVRRGAGIAALLSAGIFLGVGTRLALWAPLLVSLTGFGLLAWARGRFGGAARDRLGGRAIAIGLLVGVGSVVVAYPSAFSNPVRMLVQSVTDSSSYPTAGSTLTAGRLLSAKPPWWYLPVWEFASVPALLYVLSIIGGGGAIASMAHSAAGAGRSRLRALAGRRDLAVVLVLLQALLLPLASIVAGSSISTGLRQHLYVAPAVAILAGVGAHRIWERSTRGRKGSGLRGWIAAGVLAAALVIPMVEQSLLFPFNYTYVNPIAGIGGVNDRWETDYWWASSREALARVPDDAQPRCSATRVSDVNLGDGPNPLRCTSRLFAPYLGPFQDEQGTESAAPSVDGGGPWVIDRKRAGSTPPAYCRSEADVTRWLRGEDVIMSYVLRCDPEDVRKGDG